MSGDLAETGQAMKQLGTDICYEALDRLMPMHIVVAPSGHIRHGGPTLRKICSTTPIEEVNFFNLFDIRRPRGARAVSELIAPQGVRLKLRLRNNRDLRLKGIAVPLSDGESILANLSFGISVPDAIRSLSLNAGDFAQTDLVIEMLYLIEAKDALTSESRNLNRRLLAAKSSAEQTALTDPLTGLLNRRALDGILRQYQALGEPFSLVSLDLDHFKAVNDTLGHSAGDEVLRVVGRILTEETRSDDSIIRVGGDEFVLIFDKLTTPETLRKGVGRILNRLAQPILFEGNTCRIAGSAGVTISLDYGDDGLDPDQVLYDADVALYAAKKNGRAQVCFVRDLGGVGQDRGQVA